MIATRVQPLSLPPAEHLPTAVRKAAGEHAALLVRHRAAAQALLDLEDRRRVAADTDRASYAQALRDAKPDPGTPKTDGLDAEIVKARRLLDALSTALASSADEVAMAVGRAKETWQRDAARAETEARSAYLDAIAQLDAARAALVQTRSVSGWLEGPTDSRYKTWQPTVNGLVAPHGGSHDWATVLAALAADLPAAPAPTAAPASPDVDETQASPADLLGGDRTSTFATRRTSTFAAL